MTVPLPHRQAAAADRRFLWLVVLGGIALRLIWLDRVHGGLDLWVGAAEASNVARAIAACHGVADAYFAGQGPTAHLLPLNPAVAGAILWLLGPGTTPANLALLGWSLAQAIASWLLARRLFSALGTDAATLRWGVALLALVPAFAPQEAIDFQYWEGGTATCLALVNLVLIVELDRHRTMGARAIAGIAALSALTFFVSPPVGLAVDVCWAAVALRRLPLGVALPFGVAAAAALALTVTPWALRNQHKLGAPVLLRSNLGLELAIANHPDAISSRAPERVFADRLTAIAPMGSREAQRVIAQPGGELRYMRTMSEAARGWIAAHPGDFAMLYLRHLSEFFFPRPWQMYFSGWEGMRATRAWVVSIVSLLGLLGLAHGLWRRRRGYWIVSLYLVALALPYGVFQPMPRYIYLAHAVLAFLAVDIIRRACRWQRR